MIWLVLAVAACVATAALAAAALGARAPVSLGLAIFLLASAEVIALTEVLSLLGLVRAAGYAVGEALLLGATAGAWHLHGRPRPPRPQPGIRAGIRAHPIVAALAAIVGGALLYQAFIAFGTPPNNWDSMSYHLSRAAAWYQRHRVEYLPSHTERENAFQPNAELEVLYTFAFAGRDTAAAAVQLLGELALLLGVYGCARRLGHARPASLLAALLTATLTEVALQSVTTQNDLLAASFMVAAAYFTLGSRRVDLALAGLSVGLALGTKLTTAPALALIALLALTARPRRERLVVLAASSAIGLGLVGFYGYGLNLAETGRVLGNPSATGGSEPARVTFGGTVSTAARIVYRFTDLSGLHAPNGARSWIGGRAGNVFDGLGIARNPPEASPASFTFRVNGHANEDVSFFGPLGLLLVLPLSAGFLIAGALRRTPPRQVVLALALPVFVLAIALTFRYSTWIGRFMIAPVALTMPLAAIAYRRRAIAATLALVGAITLAVAHVYNEAKPTGVDSHAAIWSLPRTHVQAVLRPELLDAFLGVEQYVPRDKTLGVVLGFDDWDYPLYGPTLRRHVVPFPPVNMLELAERRHVHWILLGSRALRPPPRTTWTRVDFQFSGWTMYLRPEELG